MEIINFGCRLNIAEGAALRSRLSVARTGDAPNERPLIIINSCAVTSNAEREARTAIRRARRASPDARIVVTGCAAQINPDAFAAMGEVDRVLGNGEKLTPDAYRFHDDTAPRVQVASAASLTATAPQLLPAFDSHARAFLEVQNGCDHSCTFCIIPAGRGPSRSVSSSTIIETAKRLVDHGVREIVLTGVDLTSYCGPGRETLATMIEKLLVAIPQLARLRLGSIDVAEIDDALVDLLTGEERLMPHIHLSLQHGDDMMLKRMKRRHTRAQAIRLVETLLARRPALSFGADLIAGFPTEDDAAFEQSVTLLEQCHIVHPHIFPYSPRPGTPAARMPQIDRATVKQRAARLRAAGMARRNDWLAGQVCSAGTMLVELDGLSGHLDNFAPIRLLEPAPTNSITAVDIIGLDEGRLIGKVAA